MLDHHFLCVFDRVPVNVVVVVVVFGPNQRTGIGIELHTKSGTVSRAKLDLQTHIF